MKSKRRNLLVTAGALICILAVAALSKPGRAALTRLISFAGISSSVTTGPAAVVLQSSGDVEQRARARHGWSASIQNSVVRGTLTNYDRNGMATRLAAVTLYRKYPDRLRVELNLNGVVETSGYDGREAWREAAPTLTEESARDIRALLRIWPDRLFVVRAGGAAYREVGRHLEDRRPPTPWTDAVALESAAVYDLVETDDLIGPASQPTPQTRAPDRRKVYYLVRQSDSMIGALRWLEPDDPRKSVDDRGAPKLEIRVDFGKFQQVSGVMWPMEVTHWLGGRVDFQIQLSEVRLNQQMPDTLFQKPR